MSRSSIIMQKIVSLGSAVGFGWTIAHFQKYWYDNSSLVHHSEKGHSGFPIFGQVSAATAQGSIYQPQALTEFIPEPAQNAPKIAQIMRYGFPSLSNIRSLNDYVLSYDSRNRVPFWVFEHLTEEKLIKNEAVSREKCDFREDKSIHEYFRSTNADYKKSGFDRGHIAAAGNHKVCQTDCEETFLLSNMAPQVGRGFNRDKWNELEMYCRKLAKEFKNVYVCTGPLYLPRQEENGKLYVKYQVIGQNHVAVPTHFYKVIVCERYNGELELESFVLPNRCIDDNISIQTFYTPLENIERASGLLFFDRISKNKFSKTNGKKFGWF